MEKVTERDSSGDGGRSQMLRSFECTGREWGPYSGGRGLWKLLSKEVIERSCWDEEDVEEDTWQGGRPSVHLPP